MNKSNETVLGSFSGNITFLEHVVIRVSLTFQEGNLDGGKRGEIQLKLTSPQGTVSNILPRRSKDDSNDSYIDWPFLSVHFWGENPEGNWTLFVLYGGDIGTVIVSNLTFIFYGTIMKPPVIARIPDECDAVCSHGCAAPGPEYCDACRNLRNATTLECIDECSNEFVIRDGYCLVINDECVCADDQKDTCMCKESQAFGLSANNLVITLIMLCIIDLC